AKKTVSRLQHNVNVPDSIRGGGSPFTTVTYSPLSASASKKKNPDASSKAGQIVYTYGSANMLKQYNWLPSSSDEGSEASSTEDKESQGDRRKQTGSSRGTGIGFAIKANQWANESCKYMFDSSYDRVIILGDRIYECANAICKRLAQELGKPKSREVQDNGESDVKPSSTVADTNLNHAVKEEPTGEADIEREEDNFSSWFEGIKVNHVDYPSSEVIRVLGRIVVESSSSTANGTSTDKQPSTNSRNQASKLSIVDYDEHTLRYTRLDLSKVQVPSWWSLFPGQTVLLEGINPRGTMFTVKQIHCERSLTPPRAPTTLEKTVSFVIASAPYTDIDDLLYEKLASLLAYCNNNPPDVLILSGPFADADRKLYAEVAETFEEYFEKIIGTIMNSIGGNTEVFVVAHHNDLVSSFVFPTPPYKVASFYKNLHFLPNPCVFSIEGVEIGITTVDVIKHLIESECTVANVMPTGSAAPIGGDKIKRAYGHLFNQASFYPLNPPPEDVPLDVDMLNEFGRLSRIPNIMICPSALNRYVREINGCVCINPGFVDGHSTDGSFARLIIQPPEIDEQQQPRESQSALFPPPTSYIACQIVKT
uniref:DNA polymerase alpha subunit B n=1 Tax=Anopheles epiroticus TaxID=199890 RepID=A0A182PLF3_9DIPT